MSHSNPVSVGKALESSLVVFFSEFSEFGELKPLLSHMSAQVTAAVDSESQLAPKIVFAFDSQTKQFATQPPSV